MAQASSLTRILLEVQPGSDPVTGTLCVPPASPEPFFGWLELISALDREINADRPRGADPAGGGPDAASR